MELKVTVITTKPMSHANIGQKNDIIRLNDLRETNHVPHIQLPIKNVFFNTLKITYVF